MRSRKNKILIISCMVLLLLMLGYCIYQNRAVTTFALPTASKIIVIDPGHGGFDPGRVGVKGAHEKDINLEIAKKLQGYLEQSGAYVVITRIADESVAEEKRADMKKRKEIINNSEGDVMISIHQNSFTQSQYKGAQVFYHNGSEKGEQLAKNIQDELRNFVDPQNKRQPKANTDYYVLKKTEIPAVIVECGFLSNPEEEQKLNSEPYQEKIAWAIYMALVKYFEQ